MSPECLEQVFPKARIRSHWNCSSISQWIHFFLGQLELHFCLLQLKESYQLFAEPESLQRDWAGQGPKALWQTSLIPQISPILGFSGSCSFSLLPLNLAVATWLSVADEIWSERCISPPGRSFRSKCVISTHPFFLPCQSWRHQGEASLIPGPWDREKLMSQPSSDGHVAWVRGTNKQSFSIHRYFGLICYCSILCLILTDKNIWAMGAAVRVQARTMHGGHLGWPASCVVWVFHVRGEMGRRISKIGRPRGPLDKACDHC